MSLVDLAGILTQQANSSQKAVILNAATLTSAGFTVTAGLDALLVESFNLPANSSLNVATTPGQIGTPTATQLSFAGSVTALNVTSNVTVVFTANGSALTFTLLAPLGNWQFNTSWEYMAGFPYDNLVLETPAFAFSSDPLSNYAWGNHSIDLVPGLNLASTLLIADFLEPILQFVPGYSSSKPLLLLLCGSLNPAGVDNDTVLFPITDLSALILGTPVTPIAFLKFLNPRVGLEISNVQEKDELVQVETIYFGLDVDLGDQAVLDCRATLFQSSPTLQLSVASSPLKPLTLEVLFNVLMGGNTWYSVIPQPLQQLFTSFGFQNFTAVIQTKPTLTLDSISLSVGTVQPWPIFDQLKINEIDLTWTISNPTSGPQMSGLLTAEFEFYPKVFKQPDGTPGLFNVSIDTNLRISGSYDGTVSFSDLISGITGGAIQIPSTFSLIFTGFGLLLDQPNSNYALNASADLSLDVLGTGKISLTGIQLDFGASYDKTTSKYDYSASFSGLLSLGDYFGLLLNASYDGANSLWHFDGALAPGVAINLSSLLNQVFQAIDLPPFVPGDLQVTTLAVTVDVTTGATLNKKYSFNGGLSWVFSGTPLGNVEIDAALQLAYDSTFPATPYSGKISGEFKLSAINADIVLGYSFQQGNSLLFLKWAGFEAQYDTSTDVITFAIDDWTLGGLVGELVRLATNDPTFSLPEPWDLLNSISLKGFSVAFELNTKQVSASYNFSGSLDLFFIKITAITFTKDENGVNIALTAQMIGDDAPKTYNVDPVNGTAPAVPGQNTTKFELQLLALGQRVTVTGIAQQQKISDVIKLLGSFMPGTPNQLPVGPNPAPGEPTYDSSSNWLIGTHFLVLKDQDTGIALLDLMAVFNDPYLYGLRIAVAGPSAKIFAGLEFEIMYRKVTDTIGVYELVLQLPTAMRTLEFGEVSVTLPVVGLQIYTNGNFRIDFGFPTNLDFSRSFTLQAFPFTGSGGFYFGVLNGDTATQIRKSTKGTFDPVIVFGIGLQVGLGKSIDAGVLSATLSVTVFGIIEGVIAKWKPYNSSLLAPHAAHLLTNHALADSQAATDYYFWLQGTIGIIGKVQGTIDFAIISATLSVTVTIQAQITVEAYRAIPISVTAGVSVSLAVSINLGLFKITIHFSFNYTVSASFTIGSNSVGPWEPWENSNTLPLARRHRPALLATAATHSWLNTAPRFLPLRSATRTPLNLYFAPHLTLADAATSSSTQAAYVGMLYIQAPVQQGSGESPGLTDFESLATETFVWAATTFSNAQGSRTHAEALSQVLSVTEVQSAYQYFTANGPLPPIAYSQIQPFLASRFTLNIIPPPSDAVQGAAVFPMIPDLTLSVPAYNGSAALSSVFSQFPMAQPDYLSGLQTTLQQLAVELTTPLQQQYANQPSYSRAQSGTPQPQTLATLLFQDYFALICRQTLQAASDAFGNYTYTAESTDTLGTIVSTFNKIGQGAATNALTAAGLATSNRTISLSGNQSVTLSGVTYAVAASQTLAQLASVFGLTPTDIAANNQLLSGLLAPNKQATINGAPYTTGANDTFASIVANTKATLGQVATGLQHVAGLLTPLTPVAVPAFTYTTNANHTDTFESIANSFNLAIADIATANTALSFYVGTTAPSLDIADLEFLPASLLVTAMENTGLFAHLAGMCSRFLMNGLRVPINSNLALAPSSPYAGLSSGGLYGVTGQQFTLPNLAAPDADKLVVTLSDPASPSWITFPSGNALDFPVDANQIATINSVLAAAGTGLLPNVSSIAAIDAAVEAPARFAFQSSVPLQLPVALALPNGTAPTQTVPSPTVWNFSSGLLSLIAQSQLVAPVFSLQLGSTAGATGVPVNTPANNFGWATLINVSVKTLPADASPNAANTYQLLGTDSAGITLLERLVQTLTTSNYPIQGLYLLYPPNPTAPAAQGLIGADPAHLASYIVQSNLSTYTNPGASSLTALFESGPTSVPGILNDPNDFVRRLWETSIVQSGGFFLYYGADQPAATPLPQNLFNQDGTAQISLLIVYGNTSGALQPYMNAVALNDRVDVSTTTLFVESVAQSVTYTPSSNDTLTSIASQYLLTPSELAEQLAQITLATGPTLTIDSPIYQIHPGDTLASVASRFSTTGAAVQQANPNLQIDWNNLPVWLLLNLPNTTYALTTASPFTSLGAIASFYGLDVPALAWPNLTVAGLFSDTLTFNNQAIAKSAALAPGNAGVAVSRTALGSAQTQPLVYLDATFNLLGWQLASNLAFLPSPAGPPASPLDSMDQDELLEHTMRHTAPRPAASAGDDALWSYEQLFPITAFARFNPLAKTTGNLPPGNSNPYSGVGSTAQVQLSWQDLFGNVGITPLTKPSLATLPLNQPPILVAYTDPLVSLAQWPGVSADYVIQLVETQPTLELTLSFDPCRYYHTPPAPPSQKPPFPSWQQRALADRQTFAQIYYQLNQNDAAGNPHTSFAVTCTLEPGVTHTLEGSALASVNAFVVQAWQFLNDLLTDAASPVAAPSVLILSIPVTAANPLDIYELEASFTIARQAQFVHPSFRDQAGVASAVTQLSARLNDWPQLPPNCSQPQPPPTQSLAFFAGKFEAAFAASSATLHIATGPDRTAAVSSNKPIWVVRLANDLTGTLGLQIQGPSVFYAPPPLCTSLISRSNVPIYAFDPQTGLDTKNPTYPVFKDIDLDVWGRQALEAIDLVLSAQVAANAFVVDELGSSAHLAGILASKGTIAQGIANTVTNILSSPPTPVPEALSTAQERLRQQMLITLASAYSVDAVVQLPVQVNATAEPGFQPPALYGAPQIQTSSSADHEGNPNSAPPEYTLSTYKFNLKTGTTYLNFLFSTRFAEDQAFVGLKLAFPITNIEHQVGSLAETSSAIDGYTPSTWLSFVNPLPPVPFASADLSTLRIPVVLRAYPPIPVLDAQSGVSAASSQSATTTVQSAKLWNYQFGFQFPHAAQDEVGASTQLNLAPIVNKFNALSVDALFAALAQLNAVWDQLRQIFVSEMSQITLSTSTTDPSFVHSENALAAMDTLVAALAQAWSGTSALSRVADPPTEQPQLTLNYTIREVPSPQEKGPDLLEVIVTQLASVPPTVPQGLPPPPTPIEWFDDYPLTKPAPDGLGLLYYNEAGDFLHYQDAREQPTRTVLLPDMNVMAYQNARSSVSLSRNAILVPENPTLSAFVYTTPDVAFPAKLTPLLQNDQAIAVEAIQTGTPTSAPLFTQLQSLFRAFFADSSSSSQPVKLVVNYQYTVGAVGSGLTVQVPITLLPWADFQIPDDYLPTGPCPVPVTDSSPLVCKLTATLQSWFAANTPSPREGILLFDLSVFSSLSQDRDAPRMPLIRLSNLHLTRSFVTDL